MRQHQIVVFGNQDMLASALCRRLGRWLSIQALRIQRTGEIEFYAGAFARLGVDLYMPAGLLGEAEHHTQPQAAALAHRLGCKKGLEDTAQGLGVHAAARVGDANHHVVAGFDLRMPLRVVIVEHAVGGLDGELAPFRYGVAGIDREVQ